MLGCAVCASRETSVPTRRWHAGCTRPADRAPRSWRQTFRIPRRSLPALLAEWRTGAHVVWAVRHRREGESATTVGLARIYYWLMRNVAGMKEMPSTGADFFLADRRVIEAFREFRESNTSVTALITWLGFRQSRILYDKQARLYGRSGWNFEKKTQAAAGLDHLLQLRARSGS